MICIRAWAVAITVVVAAHAAGVRGGDATPPPPYELGIYSSVPPPPMDCALTARPARTRVRVTL
jgi:hypothetical protein